MKQKLSLRYHAHYRNVTISVIKNKINKIIINLINNYNNKIKNNNKSLSYRNVTLSRLLSLRYLY